MVRLIIEDTFAAVATSPNHHPSTVAIIFIITAANKQ